MSAAQTASDATAQARAAGSSFYAGMRLMPKPEREAMFAIYAFSRAVDDIADEGNAPAAERRAALDRWRRAIEDVYAGLRPPLADFLAPAIARYRLRKEDFLAVIDGMEMDAVAIRAPDFPTLDLYCDRVASAVGRLSIKVFGMDEEPGFRLAHHLGRALQLTNILRDLDEDAAAGRLYLPREFLADAGIRADDPRAVIGRLEIETVCRRVAEMAHGHYRAADTIMRARPRGILRAPRLMGAVYAQILAKMERAGWAPPRKRARMGKHELLLIVLRHGLSG